VRSAEHGTAAGVNRIGPNGRESGENATGAKHLKRLPTGRFRIHAMTVLRSTSKSLTAAAFAGAFLLAACRDRQPDEASNDSALSRDLTLAAAVAEPTPQLRDTPDTARRPIVEREELPVAPPVRRAPAPRQPAPVAERPQPAPVTTPPVVEAPAADPTPEPAPTSAPAAPVSAFAVGTTIGLTTGDRACSDANRPGDKMVAQTAHAVTGANGVVFPAGSTVVLEVATVTPGSTADESTITFRVKSVTANDVTYPIAGEVVPTGSLEKRRVDTPGADKKKVIGGAIIGAVIGRVAGGDTRGAVIGAAAGAAAGTAAARASARYETCVPAGAPLRLTVAELANSY